MKTSDLEGLALDWAVAKCEGFVQDGDPAWERGYEPFAFSADWSHGGPIIEREYIQMGGGLRPNGDAHWHALKVREDKFGCYMGYGPAPLIAAMRCFVASKLGDEVEIPEELLS